MSGISPPIGAQAGRSTARSAVSASSRRSCPARPNSTLDGLTALFAGAGFDDIATRAIEVTHAFKDFDTFWRTQTPLMHPVGKLVAAMAEADRAALMAAVRALVPAGPDGKIAYAARANAVKGRVPR